jgi:hypothetical protein
VVHLLRGAWRCVRDHRGDRLRQMSWLSALFELGEAATRTESANRPRQRSNLGDRSGHEHIAKHVLDFSGPIYPCWAIHLLDRHQVCSPTKRSTKASAGIMR